MGGLLSNGYKISVSEKERFLEMVIVTRLNILNGNVQLNIIKMVNFMYILQLEKLREKKKLLPNYVFYRKPTLSKNKHIQFKG